MWQRELGGFVIFEMLFEMLILLVAGQDEKTISQFSEKLLLYVHL